MTQHNNYLNLIQRYQAGTATVAELEELHRLLSEESSDAQLAELLPKLLTSSVADSGAELSEERFDTLYEQIAYRVNLKQSRIRPYDQASKVKSIWKSSWLRACAALLVIGLSLLGYYFWQHHGNFSTDTAELLADIAPGSNQAILTLPDGRQIQLSTAHDGIAIDGSQLVYNDGQRILQGDATQAPLSSEDWLMVSAPNGGTYSVTLPDGSQVWLNSGTSLRYPVAFAANLREVELDGEAYFSVKRQFVTAPRNGGRSAAIPFQVNTPQQIVEVLGTEFNIEAYAQMHFTATTLVEGSVRIRPTNPAVESHVLTPGQRSELAQNQLSVQQVDVEKYVAWKSGYFKFDGNLEEILGQVARWYDVRVVFDGVDPKSIEMQGLISRDKSLKELLSLMNSDEQFAYELIANDTERRLIIRRP